MKDAKKKKMPGVVIEIGIPVKAPKKAKLEDAKKDKAAGIKEGSKADLAADKEIMKKFKHY